MINKWLVPPAPPKKKTLVERLQDKLPQRYMSKEYWSNNKSLHAAIFVILLINAILFVHRAYYFKDFSMLSGLTPNPFYLLSRACGRVLHFNTVLVLALVLRNTITILRRFGLATILPLDHNIYLHKLVGFLIFFQSVLHTGCHLTNFAVNVQPNPVKFVQLTYRYWTEYYGEGMILEMYSVPPGCSLETPDSDLARFCLPGSFDIPAGVNPDYIYNNGSLVWQACPGEARPWTYAEWLLTMKPHVFGMMGGEAAPSGVALMTLLATMFICSLPFVRRRGHFETFYYTHMLYWGYFIQLLFHAPEYGSGSASWASSGSWRSPTGSSTTASATASP